jgi:hypothetical protein
MKIRLLERHPITIIAHYEIYRYLLIIDIDCKETYHNIRKLEGDYIRDTKLG